MRKVILVSAHINPGQEIGGQVVTAEEAMDLNIARAELFGVAKAKGVPVFSSITEAVQECIRLLKAANLDYAVAD